MHLQIVLGVVLLCYRVHGATECGIFDDHNAFYRAAKNACNFGEIVGNIDAETQCGTFNEYVACVYEYTRQRCGNSMALFVDGVFSSGVKYQLVDAVGPLPSSANCAILSSKAARVVPAGPKLTSCDVFNKTMAKDLSAACGDFHFDGTPTDELCSTLEADRDCAIGALLGECHSSVKEIMVGRFAYAAVDMRERNLIEFQKYEKCAAMYNKELGRAAWSTKLMKLPNKDCTIFDDNDKFYERAATACRFGNFSSVIDAEVQCTTFNRNIACLVLYTNERCGEKVGTYAEAEVSWWAKEEIVKKTGILPSTANCATLSTKAAIMIPRDSKLPTCGIFDKKMSEEISALCGDFNFEVIPTDQICRTLASNRDCAAPILEDTCGKAGIDVMLDRFSVEVVEMQAQHMEEFNDQPQCLALYSAEAPRVDGSKLLKVVDENVDKQCILLDNELQYLENMVKSCPLAVPSESVAAETQCTNFQPSINCQKDYTDKKCGFAASAYVEAGFSYWAKQRIKATLGSFPSGGACGELSTKGDVLIPPQGSALTDCNFFGQKMVSEMETSCGKFDFDNPVLGDSLCQQLATSRDCALPVVEGSCGMATKKFMLEVFTVEVGEMKSRNPTEFIKYSKCNELLDGVMESKLAGNGGTDPGKPSTVASGAEPSRAFVTSTAATVAPNVVLAPDSDSGTPPVDNEEDSDPNVDEAKHKAVETPKKETKEEAAKTRALQLERQAAIKKGKALGLMYGRGCSLFVGNVALVVGMMMASMYGL